MFYNDQRLLGKAHPLSDTQLALEGFYFLLIAHIPTLRTYTYHTYVVRK